MPISRGRRGLTLIELMISTAILAVIMTAVVSVVATVLRQRRDKGSRVDTMTNARVALSLMQFDAANAGFRFGSPPLAVRVLQDVTGPFAGTELADTTDCGGSLGTGWTVLDGTDVVEFREGVDGLSPGKVPAGIIGCAGTCTISFNGGAYPNPFDSPTVGNGSIVMFSNATTGCAAQLTSDVQTGTLQMLRLDLRTSAAATNYAQAGAGACPAGDMSITGLGRVTRYMICGPPVALVGARPGLFRQTYDGAMTQTGFTRVQEDIEDLQVSTMLLNNPALVTGSSCTGTGQSGFCWCGQTSGDCPEYVEDPTLLDGSSATAAQRTAMLARAFRVAVTAISSKGKGFDELRTFARPMSFNHIAGSIAAATATQERFVLEATFIPQNIVMVVP
jgi:prepilin-type N-terminal cleavage/methylation domain-containing protein